MSRCRDATWPPWLDVVVAVLLLAALAPLGLGLLLLNGLLAGRPLYRQVRVGRHLRPFTVLKLRTMVDGAEARGTVSVAGDPRVTRLGRLLRRIKLDELPQLVHVARGEMRLVGPRALPPGEVETLPRELAAQVYSIPPGLTGIGSLAFVDEERILARARDPRRAYFDDVLPQKMRLELEYRRRRTALTDLALLLLTVPALLAPGLGRRLAARWLPGSSLAS
jgi:lipopolysaccharide/colanic/teichoic acid biosynthesis glycosyltransferase